MNVHHVDACASKGRRVIDFLYRCFHCALSKITSFLDEKLSFYLTSLQLFGQTQVMNASHRNLFCYAVFDRRKQEATRLGLHWPLRGGTRRVGRLLGRTCGRRRFILVLFVCVSACVCVCVSLSVSLSEKGTKSGETLVEARSDTDGLIVRCIWRNGRKTNRTI